MEIDKKKFKMLAPKERYEQESRVANVIISFRITHDIWLLEIQIFPQTHSLPLEKLTNRHEKEQGLPIFQYSLE